MAGTRYALTVVYDVDFAVGPPADDEAFREVFEKAGRKAIDSFPTPTRAVRGIDVVFVSATRDSPREGD